jgi:hypothetical protein
MAVWARRSGVAGGAKFGKTKLSKQLFSTTLRNRPLKFLQNQLSAEPLLVQLVSTSDRNRKNDTQIVTHYSILYSSKLLSRSTFLCGLSRPSSIFCLQWLSVHFHWRCSIYQFQFTSLFRTRAKTLPPFYINPYFTAHMNL